MALVYLGLGTNLGNKPDNLKQAIQLIAINVGDIWSVSSFYPSSAWGYESENDFLNAALLVSTDLAPESLLAYLQRIEREMGREMSEVGSGYSDRIIDIDILFYDMRVIHSPSLQVPHPLLHKREFVLNPLAEIAPDFVHPQLNEAVLSLKNRLLSPQSGNEQFANRVKGFGFPTKRFCQSLDLKEDPELIELYKKSHSEPEMWREVLDGIREVGILEMEIYLLDNRLFMILEVPADFNWDTAFARLGELPRQKEWEALMDKFQLTQPGAGSADKWKLMERIFHLYD